MGGAPAVLLIIPIIRWPCRSRCRHGEPGGPAKGRGWGPPSGLDRRRLRSLPATHLPVDRDDDHGPLLPDDVHEVPGLPHRALVR